MSAARWYALKAAARFNRNAPYNPQAMSPWSAADSTFTPPLTGRFAGMSNSPAICNYFANGCSPPDMAVAASSTDVVQAVNMSVAVYGPTGLIKPGFPKNFTKFFGVPPPGACDPAGPFLADPRAFYDPVDKRFWVVALQVEAPFLNSCPVLSKFWVAVSKTNDPTGGWHIYSFDMKFGTTNIADYTQIGLDGSAFYFGGNMFNNTASAYLYDEIFAASKAKMEAGMPAPAKGLKMISVGGTLIDTLQPVEVEGASPSAGLFIDSFNMNSNCFGGCIGINIFAMANALTNPKLTEKTIKSLSYNTPPAADQPTCSGCVETLDTRISGTPIYRGGEITFALETGVSVGGSTNPGIMWGQVRPTLSAAGKITGATMVQNAYYSFSGDTAASFGALMSDKNGNIIMVFDSMSSTIFPGAYYTSRKLTDPANHFGPARVLAKGQAGGGGGSGGRWGDYEAAGWDGTTTNGVWIASQFANANGDWSTEIGHATLP
jgi:hypothetical protein